MHTHGDMAEDFWVFGGMAEQVFSNVSMVEDAPDALQTDEDIFSRVSRSIHSRRKLPDAARLCSYKVSSRTKVVCDGLSCRTYYRKARCVLPGGLENIVQVLLLLRQQADDVGRIFTMHSFLRVYVAGQEGVAVVDEDPHTSTRVMTQILRTHLSPLHNRDAVHQVTMSSEIDPSLGVALSLQGFHHTVGESASMTN